MRISHRFSLVLISFLITSSGCGVLQSSRPAESSSTNATNPTTATNIAVNLPPNITGKFTLSYYQVQGENTQQIQADIQQKRASLYAGKTDVDLTYTVKTHENNTECSIKAVQVNLAINIVMPKWQSGGNATNEISNKWATFHDNLLIHELGHRDIAVLHAKRISQWILSIPPQTSCQKLAEMANQRSNDAVQVFNNADAAYDTQTSHGKTQGAVLH